ncbi:MAG TPA: SMP-30/gluconolactonase/LRE family protein, partial [Vicinamibacteria bacterium]|nr:SMP-30/gluconolactonase/LRE family protein [Vicinamibacteria bacterium]
MTLLPNGWRIAPLGRHLDAGDLPLAMALHPDGRHLAITNNGWSKPSLRVVDLERWQVIQKMPLDHAWLGLVWHPDGKRLFSSGAADNSIREIEWRDGRLSPGRTIVLASPEKSVRVRELENPGFVAGLALSPDGRTLYAAHVFGESLAAVDVATGTVLARATLPAEAYGTLVSPDGRTVYVSVWGASRIALFEPLSLRPLGEIVVGEHPNAMVFSRDAARLFVACANTNAVWAVDLASRRAVEQVGVALRPEAPPGVTPNA